MVPVHIHGKKGLPWRVPASLVPKQLSHGESRAKQKAAAAALSVSPLQLTYRPLLLPF